MSHRWLVWGRGCYLGPIDAASVEDALAVAGIRWPEFQWVQRHDGALFSN